MNPFDTKMANGNASALPEHVFSADEKLQALESQLQQLKEQRDVLRSKNVSDRSISFKIVQHVRILNAQIEDISREIDKMKFAKLSAVREELWMLMRGFNICLIVRCSL